MPYNTAAGSSDLEKLQLAWREISQKFGSLHDILQAFGLAELPSAQRYGILFGCLVFVVTVSTVLILLVLGGSFRRIAEQQQTGTATTLCTASQARAQRALLLEPLLQGRERMMRRYQSTTHTKNNKSNNQSRCSPWTPLTRMLLQQAPDAPIPGEDDFGTADENTTPSDPPHNNHPASSGDTTKERYIPPFYQEHYLEAYRTCQDKPGGPILSGRPEARYEAYARAYAGCGPYTSRSYRRSYARLYEALCCRTHASDDRYSQQQLQRPHDLCGHHVRLEALEVARHLRSVFAVTSGQPALEHAAYDPNEVWGFWEEGPFASPAELEQSFVFQRHNQSNEAGFAMVHSVTDQVLGVILLRRDDPANLTIQLEPPIVPPSRNGTKEQLEACFLLLDRLFAHGYRRIQVSIDSQDAEQRKLCRRLGMTLEGCLCKDRIVKEANRDSHIYSLLNSDWNNSKEPGARAALFAKLYGKAAMLADWANAQKEDEHDEQERVLAEQKRQAEQQQQQSESKKKV